MVQYFSQVQRSSGMSHCKQTVGPSMVPSPKLYLSKAARGKMDVELQRCAMQRRKSLRFRFVSWFARLL